MSLQGCDLKREQLLQQTVRQDSHWPWLLLLACMNMPHWYNVGAARVHVLHIRLLWRKR